MSKDMYIFFGALIGAFAAYITARVTSKNQIKIAELNAQKDLKLQEDRLYDERLKSKVSLERDKLERLHIILSRIALENSQTMSFIQSDSGVDLKQFRTRYLENCERLHEARAIVDLFFPEMSEPVREVYGQSNVFWGHQEGVLRTDIKANKQTWELNLFKVLKAGEEVSDYVRHLQHKITSRGEGLNKALDQACK